MPASQTQDLADTAVCYWCLGMTGGEAIMLALWDTIAQEAALGDLEILTEDGIDILDELGAPLLIE